MNRREGGHGLLENHGDLSATHGPYFTRALAQLRQVKAAAIGAVQQHAAAHDAARLIDNLQNRARRDTFAAATLAHHAQGFAALHVKGNAVNRLDGAGTDREVGLQVAHLQQQAAGAAGRQGREGLAGGNHLL